MHQDSGKFAKVLVINFLLTELFQANTAYSEKAEKVQQDVRRLKDIVNLAQKIW